MKISNQQIDMFVNEFLNSFDVHDSLAKAGISCANAKAVCNYLGFKYNNSQYLPEIFSNLTDIRLLEMFYKKAYFLFYNEHKALRSIQSKLSYCKNKYDNTVTALNQCQAERDAYKDAYRTLGRRLARFLDEVKLPWYLRIFGGEKFIKSVKGRLLSEITRYGNTQV